MKRVIEMSIEQNAGNAVLALSASTGVANWLSQADTIISIVVGVLSAVGIVYSIIWHRVRIKNAKKKNVVAPKPQPKEEGPLAGEDRHR